MKINKTFINDLLIIEPQLFKDDRGFFYESYNKNNLDKVINVFFVQDNESKSKKGVVRGLHFQLPPFEQTKLVRCVSGKILDVVVDLRTNSKTYGKSFSIELSSENNKATVFGYNVNNPSDFGIASFDTKKNLINIEEKPKSPKSNTAVVGLYFYPNSVVKIANKIQPSNRGEFEISSVNQCYLDNKELKIEILGRGFTWLDTGTHDSLLEASNFIKTVEKHSGYKVACLEEIAFKMKFINLKKLKELTKPFGDSSYGKYLKSLVNENQ